MTISDIKSQLTLATVLHHYQLTPDKNNRLCCPFHDDKTPSLQVYHQTNTAYCFSTNCKTHGKSLDVIDFIMYMEGFDKLTHHAAKHEAIMKAKELLGVKKVKSSNELTRVAVLRKVFDYYQNGLLRCEQAQNYLKSRSLNADKLEVGYNSAQFHYVHRDKKDLIASCKKLGLLNKSGQSRTGEAAYSSFGRHGIVFPLKNKKGQIVSLYFRSTKDVKGQNHYYLRDRQGLYPHYPNVESRKLILTESIIDAATLLQFEAITNTYEVLALYGTNGLTAEHEAAIQEWLTPPTLDTSLDGARSPLGSLHQKTHLGASDKELILWFDGDEAGDKAVAKYAPMLRELKAQTKITYVETPRGEDINSLLVGHSEEILHHFISRRNPSDDKLFLSSESAAQRTEEVRRIPPSNPKSEVVTAGGLEPETKNGAAKLNTTISTRLDTSNPYNIKYTGQEADYYCRGQLKSGLDSLKVSLQIIHRTTARDYRAKLDLYEYARIESLATKAAEHLKLDEQGITRDLMNLAKLLEQHRLKHLPKKTSYEKEKITVPPATMNKCLDFLKDKDLIQRLNDMIGTCGITGEETNRIFLFGIALSYKMPDTLHALIQGSSGSGKSRLLKVICELMPPEDVIRFTRVTESSFYNYPENFLAHKLIGFEDMDGLKEEAQLAVRELISNEMLVSSTSSKTESGEIVAMAKTVRGPIASIACTTRGEVYEDNMSRVFLIAVDESRDQTMRIIGYQQARAAGLIRKSDEKKTTHFIQNCVRLLQPYEVVNPYARQIRLPEAAHKIRRLNELYLSFVKQVTLLHQHQRKQDKHGRLITTVEDLRIANEIMFESIVLKVDELDGSLRQFFERLKCHVKSSGKDEFILREIRQKLKMSRSQLHRYISDLIALEYLQIVGGHANRGYEYKVSYWDDIEALRTRIRRGLDDQIKALESGQN